MTPKKANIILESVEEVFPEMEATGGTLVAILGANLDIAIQLTRIADTLESMDHSGISVTNNY